MTKGSSKVLITGATGFVGTHLDAYLTNRDFIVDALSRKLTETKYTYDTVTASFLSKYDAFIHLAGKAHDLKNTSEEESYFEANTDLTIRLFDKFIESDCRIFIYMSSVKAIADTVEGVLLEDHVPVPKTPYGRSKQAAELYLLSKSIPKGKRLYILRPCMIHGPGNKGNLNLLYKLADKGIPYPLAAYDNKRSFLSVDNLCLVIELLIDQKPESGTFNVADDYPISTLSVYTSMQRELGKKERKYRVPKSLIESLAALGSVLKLPLTTERLEKLTESYVVSNAKIKESLGVKDSFDTKKGLVKTIHSFKAS